MLKVAIFCFLFWLVSVKGAAHISIFRLGYPLAHLCLLLFSTKMQKNTPACLLPKECLILYKLTVTVSKNMLLFLSWVYLEQMQSNFFWAIQL